MKIRLMGTREGERSAVMSTLVAINALAATRPAAQAPSTIVAAWYEHKALVLHQIAGTCGSPAEHDAYESLAVQAHQHAVRLAVDRHATHCSMWTTANQDLTDQTCDCRGDDDA